MNRLSAFIDPRTIPAPISQDQVQMLGSKAANLDALRRAGFRTPEFEILSADWFRRFVHGQLLTIPAALSDQEAQPIIDRILTAPLPAELLDELGRIRKRLGDKPMCVRSSGTCEDLAGMSFAGQYESFLNLQNDEAIARAVRECWASLFNPRVRGYLKRHGISLQHAGMALLVQEYVPAEYAGVAFTANPLTGRQNHLLLEYCAGGADKLVAGRITPSQAVFDFESGHLLSGSLPPGMASHHLTEFRQIQKFFGAPQDIEWIWHNGSLCFVQTRPITSIKTEASFGTWTTADFRDGGVSSSVATPFMWSLYDYIWQFAMPGYCRILGLLDPGADQRPWGGMFFGRPYWNIGEVLTCLLKIPGFHERNLFSDLGIQTEAGYPFRSVPYSIEKVTGVLPTLLKLEHYYRFRIQDNRRYRREFPELIKPFTEGRLERLSAADFAGRFRELITRLYFRTETSYFMTIYNTSNAKLDFKVRLDAVNERGHDLSYIKLISGLLRVKHLAPLKSMSHLAQQIAGQARIRENILKTPTDQIDSSLRNDPEGTQLLELFDQFIDLYSYHSSRELDISFPRWHEDRHTVWKLLKTYLREPDPESAISHERRQHEMYRQEVARARQAFGDLRHRLLPFERWLFFRALLRTRTYCWWREEMRDYSSRVYAIIRTWALEAGRRLRLADGEIFWLTWQQTLAALEGRMNGEQVRDLLSQAVEQALLYRHFENPDELGAGFLAKIPPETTGDASGGTRLSGVGCSPGVAVGTARLIRSLEDSDRLQRGEILVTRFTDPGWTPIFHLLGGVVTETGGVLSHAAVISREYGIPAILNLTGATQRIRDGQRLRIDGSSGIVEVLP
ncbi:MAG TPA: PEP/pyruvate-binding domain-containing protein [Candidatus Ozemobacteraceae bacterium]|nr:PEP/pyruvate-binding domain-containing protein [Candidatus Ozemobacteraceae bacterium]